MTMPFNHKDDFYSEDYISNILNKTRNIALVGASDKEHRASYRVMKFLLNHGYNVYPVAPRLAGKELLGQKVYSTLGEIPYNIDMIDVFRNSIDAGGVFDEAIATKAKIVWTQLDVINFEAAQRAEDAGIEVVMNRCPAIEIPKLNIHKIEVAHTL